MRRQQLRRAVKRVFTGQLVGEFGWSYPELVFQKEITDCILCVTCPNFVKTILSYLILFKDNMLNFMLNCN